MGKFSVFVRGENILTDVDGVMRRVGFFTTCCVEADSEEVAGQSAVACLRADPKMIGFVRNPEGDPFRLVIEDVRPVGTFAGLKLPRTGLAMFPE